MAVRRRFRVLAVTSRTFSCSSRKSTTKGASMSSSQRRRRPAQPLLRKLQQQAKRVAVGSNRVGARLTLLHQPLCEEAFQQGGESRLARHDDSPQRRSSRAIACAFSSGQLL